MHPRGPWPHWETPPFPGLWRFLKAKTVWALFHLLTFRNILPDLWLTADTSLWTPKPNKVLFLLFFFTASFRLPKNHLQSCSAAKGPPVRREQHMLASLKVRVVQCL